MKKRIAFLITIGLLISFSAHSQNKADDIIGIWLTGGKEPAKIEIYKSGVKFYGKIIWLKNPTENGKQRMDGNNPEKEKRSNPIIGLEVYPYLEERKHGPAQINTSRSTLLRLL